MAVDLTEKIGPLSLGGWLAAVGGGLGVAYYWRKKSAASSATSATVATIGAVANPQQGAGDLSANQATIPAGSADSTTAATGPADNQAWSVLAQNKLIAEGYDPATVANAIGNYLSSNTLTSQQQAIVSEALRAAGPTPEAVAPALATPAAPVPTGTQTQASNYVGAQWHAGQKVVIGGSAGIADSWYVLAKKIMSSNTWRLPNGQDNVGMINYTAAQLKAANKALALKYPSAVPNTQTLVIPTIPGINAPKVAS